MRGRRPPGGPRGFPEQLGEFRLIERLGGGGRGVVYLAHQTSLKRDVALKLIRPEQTYFPGARARFRREALTLATLNHPTSPPLVGNLGLLDPLGRATMQFLLPAGVAAGLAGATAHHAYALLDLAALTVTHASNAVPVALVP